MTTTNPAPKLLDSLATIGSSRLDDMPRAQVRTIVDRIISAEVSSNSVTVAAFQSAI